MGHLDVGVSSRVAALYGGKESLWIGKRFCTQAQRHLLPGSEATDGVRAAAVELPAGSTPGFVVFCFVHIDCRSAQVEQRHLGNIRFFRCRIDQPAAFAARGIDCHRRDLYFAGFVHSHRVKHGIEQRVSFSVRGLLDDLTYGGFALPDRDF